MYAAIKSPMFMFAGLGSDGLVSQSWVQSAYNAMADGTEAYFWTCRGCSHIPVPNTWEMEISIPWFRWKLLGDQAACEAFYALRGPFNWTVEDEQNAVPCGVTAGSVGGGGTVLSW